MILNEDKRKDPPSASQSSVSEMLALECFAAIKEGNAKKLAASIEHMVELQLMKRGE